MVSPCFFSSCTPSSLVKPGSRNLLKKLLGSNQDKQCEPRCHGSFSKVHTSHDVSLLNMPQHDAAEVLISVHHQSCGSKEEYSMQVEQGKTKKKVFSDSLISLSAEVSDNVNENGHRGHFISSSETNKTEQENLFSTSATNRMFPTTGKVPDMTIPQEDCAQDGKLGRPVLSKKVPQRLKRGKSREKQQLPEGKSWLHPRVLKKAPRKHQNMIIASKIPVLNNSLDLSKKFTKGGNFVKLNLNGKGSGSRKFVNKGSKRKAMSSVQSFRRGKKLKVDTEHVGTNPLHDVDDADIIDMDEHGNYEEESKTRSLQGRARKLTRETCHLEQTFGDSKCFQIGEKDASDKVILREAAENALREPSDENLLKLLKMTYGYNSFRDGQLETIKRVVAKQSTMLVLPTGSGKSLCYQLPALILPGVTLVISPLVALMVDQLQHLPPMISGSLITSSQTGKDIVETLDRLRAGDIKVLFISPERLLNDNFLSTIECLPLISLVVVDEAHCLSEWSHNFRPSYFRLGSILRKRLRVQCVLAMTATATRKTLHSILCSLEIPLSDVVQVSYLRENIKLSVSLSENRLKDLLLLMKSSPFLEAQSIIIYCKFQSETDSVSKFLRDNSIPAKSYHSALTAKDRNRTQDMFCSNKLRVVVATVAFGMGLDKSDVEAVIHYSLPGSLEHYVQETGRAGRDGRLAHCHMFLDDPTYFKLRSLAYSDGADEYAVNKFLCEVFVANKDKASQICSFNIASASRSFDLKEEVMATILSYLEIGDVQYLRMLPQLNATCSICFHKSSPTLLAKRSILIDVVLKRAQPKHGHYVFDIPTVANETGAMVSQVLKELEKLQEGLKKGDILLHRGIWYLQLEGFIQFSGEITYDLKDPAFCYIIFKVPENICSLTLLITSWLAEVEASKVRKLDAMYLAATQAVKSGKQYDGCGVSLQQSCLQRLIQDYFESDRESVDGSLLNKARPIRGKHNFLTWHFECAWVKCES